MAVGKQMGFLARYVEKVVLAVCAVLFLYGLFHWGLSSPLDVPTSALHGAGQDQTPVAEVDQKLGADAKALDTRMSRRDRDRTEVKMPRYGDIIAHNRAQPFGNNLVMTDFGTPRLALDEYVPPTATKIALAALTQSMPAAGAPVVRAVRILPQAKPLKDRIAFHGVAIYPLADLEAAWRERLRGIIVNIQPIFADVEVEVRQRRPGGRWGPSKKVELAARPLVDRANEPVEVPTVPIYNDKDGWEPVQQAVRELAMAQWQEHILQPDYYDVWWSAGRMWVPWEVHLPRNELSELGEPGKAIDPRRRPVGMPVGPGMEGYPGPTGPRGRTRTPVVPRRTGTRGRRPPIDPGMEMEPGRMPPGYRPPTVRPGTPVKRPARKPVRRTRKPTSVIDLSEPLKRPVPTPVPTLAVQRAAGKVLVWFHDTSATSVIEYSYRVRLKLVNPLLSRTDDVKDPKDAQVPYVYTSWSAWSAQSSVPRATEFFLLAGGSRERGARVEVFSYALGQRVRKVFHVLPGGEIGGTDKAEVLNPEAQQLERREVDFATGALAVAVDFRVPVRKRGVTPPIDGLSTVLLYQNEKGRLDTRVSIFDSKSLRYERLKAEANQGRPDVARR